MKLTKENIEKLSFCVGMKRLSLIYPYKNWQDIDDNASQKILIVYSIESISENIINLCPEFKTENILKEIEEVYNNCYKLTEPLKLTRQFLYEHGGGIHNALAEIAKENKNIKIEDIEKKIAYFLNQIRFEELVICFFGNEKFSSQMKFLEMLAEVYNNEYRIKE